MDRNELKRDMYIATGIKMEDVDLLFSALSSAGLAVVPVECPSHAIKAVDKALFDEWPNAKKMTQGLWRAAIKKGNLL